MTLGVGPSAAGATSAGPGTGLQTTTPAIVPAVTIVDPTPPLFPRRPNWRTLLGIVLASIVVTAVCAQIAYGLATLQPNVWEARSEIEYRGQAWVETASAELSSRSRIEVVAAEYNIPIKKFEERLTAGAVPGTQLLAYSYRDEDPNVALGVVQRLTDSYLAPPETSSADSVQRIVDEIDELNAQLEGAKVELAAASGPVELPASSAERVAESEVNRLQNLLTTAEDRLLEAELAQISEADEMPGVVTAPYVLPEPVEPKPLRRAALGVIVGLLCSAVLAALILSRDLSGRR